MVEVLIPEPTVCFAYIHAYIIILAHVFEFSTLDQVTKPGSVHAQVYFYRILDVAPFFPALKHPERESMLAGGRNQFYFFVHII